MERASPRLREAQERERTWAGICLRPAGSCGGVCGQEGVGAERRNTSDGMLGVD